MHSRGKHSRIQVTGMIEWGQKSHAEFLSLKNLQKGKQVWLYCNLKTMQLRYTGTITNLPIVLNGQKNPYLNQATKNDIYKIFPAKKIPESKISNPNKILRSFPPLEIRSIPLGIRTDIKFRILHPGFLT